MNRSVICAFAMCVLTAVSQSASAENPDWRLVRSVPHPSGGTVDLVLIPESRQRDRPYYTKVADEVCEQRTVCMVNFWADPTHIPQTDDAWFPVSDLAFKTASYERSPAYKTPALHLACWLYPNKAAGEADKCEYQPGAKSPPDK